MRESRYPQNTETSLYLLGEEAPLSEIIEKAKGHFGHDINFEDFVIGREHFHARCIGYDLYDSSDYDDYIYIRRK